MLFKYSPLASTPGKTFPAVPAAVCCGGPRFHLLQALQRWHDSKPGAHVVLYSFLPFFSNLQASHGIYLPSFHCTALPFPSNRQGAPRTYLPLRPAFQHKFARPATYPVPCMNRIRTSCHPPMAHGHSRGFFLLFPQRLPPVWAKHGTAVTLCVAGALAQHLHREKRVKEGLHDVSLCRQCNKGRHSGRVALSDSAERNGRGTLKHRACRIICSSGSPPPACLMLCPQARVRLRPVRQRL